MSLLSYRFDSIDTYFELKADSFRICIYTRKPVFVGAIRLLSLRYEEANWFKWGHTCKYLVGGPDPPLKILKL